MAIPVSVCIIAKNEEKHIGECLKRLVSYEFEIIVLDTGSTDRTKEIASQYATRVESYTWENDFSKARNKVAEYASNNWILSLDCDEYVEKMDVSALRKLMQQYPKCAGVIRLKNMVNCNNMNQYDEVYDDVIRFYNRNYYEFKSPIHERLKPIEATPVSKKMECFLMPMEVTHWGYALSADEMQKKQERNLELLYHQLEERQDAYLYFQIGQSDLVLGHYGQAAAMFEKGLALCPPIDEVYVQEMIISMTKAYASIGRMEDAVHLMERYEGKCDGAKFLYTFGNVYMDAGQPLKALMKYVHTTLQDDKNMLGTRLQRCYQHIIDIYHQFGEDELANVFVQKLGELQRG